MCGCTPSVVQQMNRLLAQPAGVPYALVTIGSRISLLCRWLASTSCPLQICSSSAVPKQSDPGHIKYKASIT